MKAVEYMVYKSSPLKTVEWKLDMDLVSDMQGALYDRLQKDGYKNISLERATYQYFNAKKGKIESKPRKIHRSKEFRCPELYQTALNNFEEKVRQGE